MARRWGKEWFWASAVWDGAKALGRSARAWRAGQIDKHCTMVEAVFELFAGRLRSSLAGSTEACKLLHEILMAEKAGAEIFAELRSGLMGLEDALALACKSMRLDPDGRVETAIQEVRIRIEEASPRMVLERSPSWAESLVRFVALDAFTRLGGGLGLLSESIDVREAMLKLGDVVGGAVDRLETTRARRGEEEDGGAAATAPDSLEKAMEQCWTKLASLEAREAGVERAIERAAGLSRDACMMSVALMGKWAAQTEAKRARAGTWRATLRATKDYTDVLMVKEDIGRVLGFVLKARTDMTQAFQAVVVDGVVKMQEEDAVERLKAAQRQLALSKQLEELGNDQKRQVAAMGRDIAAKVGRDVGGTVVKELARMEALRKKEAEELSEREMQRIEELEQRVEEGVERLLRQLEQEGARGGVGDEERRKREEDLARLMEAVRGGEERVSALVREVAAGRGADVERLEAAVREMAAEWQREEREKMEAWRRQVEGWVRAGEVEREELLRSCLAEIRASEGRLREEVDSLRSAGERSSAEVLAAVERVSAETAGAVREETRRGQREMLHLLEETLRRGDALTSEVVQRAVELLECSVRESEESLRESLEVVEERMADMMGGVEDRVRQAVEEQGRGVVEAVTAAAERAEGEAERRQGELLVQFRQMEVTLLELQAALFRRTDVARSELGELFEHGDPFVEIEVPRLDGDEGDLLRARNWSLTDGLGRSVDVARLQEKGLVELRLLPETRGLIVEGKQRNGWRRVPKVTLLDCSMGRVRVRPHLERLEQPVLVAVVVVKRRWSTEERHDGGGGKEVEEARDAASDRDEVAVYRVESKVAVNFANCTPYWLRNVLKAHYAAFKVRMTISQEERPLDALFHDVTLVDRAELEDGEGDEEADEEGERRRQRGGVTPSASTPVEAAPAVGGSSVDQDHLLMHVTDPRPRILVQGVAGVGKTTVLRRIAWGWAGQGGEALQWVRAKYRWVLFLRLSSLGVLSESAPDETLRARWLHEEVGELIREQKVPGREAVPFTRAETEALCHHLLQLIDGDGDLLVLADGLDEVHKEALGPDSPAQKVWGWVKERGDVIVTTRPRDLEGFKPSEKGAFRLEGLTAASQAAFVEDYVGVEAEGDETVGRREELHRRGSVLTTATSSHAALRRLSRCPVLLEILCEQFVAQNAAANFVELGKSARLTPIYRRALRDIYARFAHKSFGVKFTEDSIDDVFADARIKAVHAYYSDVAMRAWSADSSGREVDGTVLRAALTERGRGELEAAGVMDVLNKEEGERVLLEEVGLLRKVTTARKELMAPGVKWAFLHRSFLEYLVAEKFVEEARGVLSGMGESAVLGGMEAPLSVFDGGVWAWLSADRRAGELSNKLRVGKEKTSRVWGFVVGRLHSSDAVVSAGARAFVRGLVMKVGVLSNARAWMEALAELPEDLLRDAAVVGRYLPAGVSVTDAMFAACAAGVWSMVGVCAELLKPSGLATLNRRGLSLLHAAVEGSDMEGVEWLLEHGLSAEVKDQEGREAWWRWVESDCDAGGVHAVAAEVMRRARRKVDEPLTSEGQSPLHLAAASGHLAAVRTLVACGATKNLRDKDGCTPLVRAEERRFAAVVQALQKVGAEVGGQEYFRKELRSAWERGDDRVQRSMVRRLSGATAGEVEELLMVLRALATSETYVCAPGKVLEMRRVLNALGWMGPFERLRTLRFANAGLTAADTTLLASRLAAVPRLTSLDLGQNALGDTGAAAIAECLSAVPALLSLDLQTTAIGDAGAAALASGLSALSALRVLDLRGNAIGEEAASKLPPAVARLEARSSSRGAARVAGARDQQERRLKLVVLGADGRVGTTSIVRRFCTSTFDDMEASSISSSYKETSVKVEGKDVPVTVWDTGGGQEKFHALKLLYYRDAEGVLLVYDITDLSSFRKVRRWVTELREHAPRAKLCIAGNKCDLESRREVRREDAESFAASVGIPQFACSAKTGDGVNNAFRAITESMAWVPLVQQAPVQRPLGRADDAKVRLKVVALGRTSAVGTSALVKRFTKGKFMGTIGTSRDFDVSVLTVDGVDIKLNIWENGGQERWHILHLNDMRGADGTLIIYDITDATSFKSAQTWLEEVQLKFPEVQICLVGTKCDLEDERKVDRVAAEAYAASRGVPHFLVSAKTGAGVQDAFEALARAMLRARGVLKPSTTAATPAKSRGWF